MPQRAFDAGKHRGNVRPSLSQFGQNHLIQIEIPRGGLLEKCARIVHSSFPPAFPTLLLVLPGQPQHGGMRCLRLQAYRVSRRRACAAQLLNTQRTFR